MQKRPEKKVRKEDGATVSSSIGKIFLPDRSKPQFDPRDTSKKMNTYHYIPFAKKIQEKNCNIFVTKADI